MVPPLQLSVSSLTQPRNDLLHRVLNLCSFLSWQALFPVDIYLLLSDHRLLRDTEATARSESRSATVSWNQHGRAHVTSPLTGTRTRSGALFMNKLVQVGGAV